MRISLIGLNTEGDFYASAACGAACGAACPKRGRRRSKELVWI